MASEPAAPDWYSHGLNRVAYYRLADPPIRVKPGEEQAGLTTVVAALERVIRAHPTQWFNFVDAWSPPGGHP